MRPATGLLCFLLFVTSLRVGHSSTNSQDAAALRALMIELDNMPSSWGRSNDPCDTPWLGVTCNNSRVTDLRLPMMGIRGTLSGDIGQLTELQYLDLSCNKGLGGSLTPNIGNLLNLTVLILSGCSFNGNIPSELGKLRNLTYLDLNSNMFSGTIPASLGGLSNVLLLDLSDNQLSGPLPISTKDSPGLDQLLKTGHFHFSNNQLSGQIPEGLFSSGMQLIHLIFNGNQFTGNIPTSIGLLPNLEALRLDTNSLSGDVPSNINSLTTVKELNLANNKLTGPLPNLTGMSNLHTVDLSNNTFDHSDTPAWFSTLQSLTALVIENGGIRGEVPQELFSLPALEQVILKNNEFYGNLTFSDSISQQLEIVNFQNNDLTSFPLSSRYNGSLILIGNPVCNQQLLSTATPYCSLPETPVPYSTSIECGNLACPRDQKISPNCSCAYPLEGEIIFRTPSFRDVSNSNLFQVLERNLTAGLGLAPGSVILQNPLLNTDSDLQVEIKFFPENGRYFNQSEVLRIGSTLHTKQYRAPPMFGTYYFIGDPYPFPGGGSSMAKGFIIGISVGCALLIVGLVGMGFYAFRQKKQAQRSRQLSRPFASWKSSGKDYGKAPELKGARWFPYDELSKSTNNFSETNVIGTGGYGKVYKGMIPGGQLVAIKRAKEGSMQGAIEFKAEIELLSRVHHKNLVGLIGFCFEQGEQMLVYEFISNGTLRESLSGDNDIQLEWKRRLRIALGSARGLAYLHELADPPIIHRDVKTSNILLDKQLTAKVADFGLSKLVSDATHGHVSSQVKGTMGYLDPEYYMTQHLTAKSDVYSFGVVMLELVTGRKPIEKGRYVVREVKIALDNSDEEYYGLVEVMDPFLQTKSDLIGFRRFVELAMQCLEDAGVNRPTMSEVVKEIEMILHRDELNTDSIAFSHATEFESRKYSDSSFSKDVSGFGFDYSGGYSIQAEPEPK